MNTRPICKGILSITVTELSMGCDEWSKSLNNPKVELSLLGLWCQDISYWEITIVSFHWVNNGYKCQSSIACFQKGFTLHWHMQLWSSTLAYVCCHHKGSQVGRIAPIWDRLFSCGRQGQMDQESQYLWKVLLAHGVHHFGSYSSNQRMSVAKFTLSGTENTPQKGTESHLMESKGIQSPYRNHSTVCHR